MKQDYIKTIREACWKANAAIEQEQLDYAEIWGRVSALGGGNVWSSLRKRDWKIATDLFERPIRLADVLVALKRHDTQVSCVLVEGHFSWLESLGQDDGDYHETAQTKVGPRGGILKGSTPIGWNLYKDRLEDQSEECLKFLADLLSPSTSN